MRVSVELGASLAVLSTRAMLPGRDLACAAATFTVAAVTRAHILPSTTTAFLVSDRAYPRRAEILARLAAQVLACFIASQVFTFAAVSAAVTWKQTVFALAAAGVTAAIRLRAYRTQDILLSCLVMAFTAFSTANANLLTTLACLFQHGWTRLTWRAVAPTLGAGVASGVIFSSRSLFFQENSQWRKFTRAYRNKLQDFGLAGLLSYGLLNTLYYTVVFSFVWYKGNFTLSSLASTWAITWAGSQVTKPLRFWLSIAIAPVMKSVLTTAGVIKKKDNKK